MAHEASIAAHLNRAELEHLLIGLLVEAGRTAEAESRLDAPARLLGDDRTEAFREQIRAGAGGSTLAQLEGAYADDGSTASLAQLVGALASQGFSDRFFELVRRLVTATRSVATAESAVRLLLQARRWGELAVILDENAALVGQSRELRNAHAWSAYMRGDLRLARSLLTGLQAEADDESFRSLQVNMLLVSGRWPDIARLVEDEWARRADRKPQELLDLAQLAGQVGSGRVRELIGLAARAAPTDPHVLARSYMLATQAGLDGGGEIHGWLETAAALSGEDGPIQRADLAELFAGQPDWDSRAADVWTKLRAGAIPLYVGAMLLRRPSLELRLGAMVGNQREADPRRRAAVPAFSGMRGDADLRAGTLGLDGSSLIMLGLLGLVDAVVARGPVVIPHNTLGWLFKERQRLAFHQPSRIAFARKLQRELGAGRLLRFAPSATVDGKLADSVGRSLAAMLATAAARPDGAPPRLVVRSAPVERIGTFRGEAVDLVAHAGVLCSCQRVVDALTEGGHLTAAQERHARTYLEVNEQRWPDEPDVPAGAELYLDDLSISYLDTAGVLDILPAGGFKVHVSEREAEEATALLELEARSEDIEGVIEHIRSALARGIDAGTVTLSPLAEGEEVQQHPDLRLVDLAGAVGAIVSDDRYINRVRQIDGPDGSSPVWTSLDLLAVLRLEDVIGEPDLVAHRAKLCRSGLVLFPTDADELAALVSATRLRDGEMVETGELRAFRENLQLALMRRFLALPEEADYLQSLSRAAVGAVLRQWTAAIPDDLARARSRWLMARADLRDWAGVATDGGGGGLAIHGLAIPVTSLLTHRLDVEAAGRARFDAWLEEEVIGPMRHQDPAGHEWLLQRTREVILAIGEGGADV